MDLGRPRRRCRPVLRQTTTVHASSTELGAAGEWNVGKGGQVGHRISATAPRAIVFANKLAPGRSLDVRSLVPIRVPQVVPHGAPAPVRHDFRGRMILTPPSGQTN